MTRKQVNRIYKVMQELRDKADDFAGRVAPLYVALDWTWTIISAGGEPKVPDIGDIQGCLSGLLNAVERNLHRGNLPTNAATGGLEVRVFEDAGRLKGTMEFTVRKVAYGY